MKGEGFIGWWPSTSPESINFQALNRNVCARCSLARYLNWLQVSLTKKSDAPACLWAHHPNIPVAIFSNDSLKILFQLIVHWEPLFFEEIRDFFFRLLNLTVSIYLFLLYNTLFVVKKKTFIFVQPSSSLNGNNIQLT